MNWAPSTACLWVLEPWGSFEQWGIIGIMGCRWVKAFKQLGDAGSLEGVCG